MKIVVYTRGWYERKPTGMPVFHPGYLREYTGQNDVPEVLVDHVTEMLRGNQVIRDTGLEVIQIREG